MRPTFWLVLFVIAALGAAGCGYAVISHGLALSGRFSAERRSEIEANADCWLIAFVAFAVAMVATFTGYVVSLARRMRK